MHKISSRINIQSIRKIAFQRHVHQTSKTLMTFEGNVSGLKMTEEERAATIFGTTKNKYTADKLKGYGEQSSRFVSRAAEYYQIGNVKIPFKPTEPDNCCMSGCVNCVWLMYQDDLQHWKSQRRIAAKQINKTDEIWPEEFKPPIHLLNEKNIPENMRHLKHEAPKKKLTTFSFPPKMSKEDEKLLAAQEEAKAAEEADAELVAAEDVTPEFIKQFTRFEKRKAEERLHKLEHQI